MGGRRSVPQVKETEQEKAAAEIANRYWDLYQNELKGFEDTFIQRVQALGNDAGMQRAKSSAELGYNQAFSRARGHAAQRLAAAGTNPNSGRFAGQLGELTLAQAQGQTDTINRAQASEQDRYVAGLSDVNALGMGQQAQNLTRMGEVAELSLRRAGQDAATAFNQKSALLYGAGTAAGMGLSHALYQDTGGTVTDGISTQSPRPYHPTMNPKGSLYS